MNPVKSDSRIILARKPTEDAFFFTRMAYNRVLIIPMKKIPD